MLISTKSASKLRICGRRKFKSLIRNFSPKALRKIFANVTGKHLSLDPLLAGLKS